MVEIREPEQDLLILGEAFRDIREQRDLSVGELAGTTDVSEARIAALEEGRLEPDFELIMKLAKGIGVPSAAFFQRAEEL